MKYHLICSIEQFLQNQFTYFPTVISKCSWVHHYYEYTSPLSLQGNTSTKILIKHSNSKHVEWWVLCSAYFTIKYRYTKCQTLHLFDLFCYIHELNIVILFVVVWMLNFITRCLQRLLLRTVCLPAMDEQTCTVLGAKIVYGT